MRKATFRRLGPARKAWEISDPLPESKLIHPRAFRIFEKIHSESNRARLTP